MTWPCSHCRRAVRRATGPVCDSSPSTITARPRLLLRSNSASISSISKASGSSRAKAPPRRSAPSSSSGRKPSNALGPRNWSLPAPHRSSNSRSSSRRPKCARSSPKSLSSIIGWPSRPSIPAVCAWGRRSPWKSAISIPNGCSSTSAPAKATATATCPCPSAPWNCSGRGGAPTGIPAFSSPLKVTVDWGLPPRPSRCAAPPCNAPSG